MTKKNVMTKMDWNLGPTRPLAMPWGLRRQAGWIFLVCLLVPVGQLRAQTPSQTPAPSHAAPPASADPASADPASASSAPASTLENGNFVIHTRVDEVVVNVTVTDKHQHLVRDLAKKNFSVFEDNAPQKITSFRHEDLPISLGILIDNSGSMSDKRTAVSIAALDMVRASNPEDESFIVNFSDDAYLDQDFTSSIPKLQQGLAHLDSKGGTALYDAVVAAADHLAQAAKRPKQVLLIITDGQDDSSSSTLEQTVRGVQDLQGPIIYTIGLLFGDGSNEAKHARHVLQRLSDETGGLAYFPKSLKQVDAIAEQVAEVIRNQYTLSYHPTKPENVVGYRTIRVAVKAAGLHKLHAWTRAGYYPGMKPSKGTK